MREITKEELAAIIQQQAAIIQQQREILTDLRYGIFHSVDDVNNLIDKALSYSENIE